MRSYKLIAVLVVFVGGLLGFAAFFYAEHKEEAYISSVILRIPAELRSDLVLPMYQAATKSTSKANLLLSSNTMVLTYVGANPEAASAELSRAKNDIVGSGRQVAERNSEAIEGQKARVDQAITDLSLGSPNTDSSAILALMTLTNQLEKQIIEVSRFKVWVLEQELTGVDTRKMGISSLTYSVFVFFVFVLVGLILLYVYARRRGSLKVKGAGNEVPPSTPM